MFPEPRRSQDIVYDILDAVAVNLSIAMESKADMWVFLRGFSDRLGQLDTKWRLAFRPDLSGLQVVDKDYWERELTRVQTEKET